MDKRTYTWRFHLDNDRPCVIISERSMTREICNQSSRFLPERQGLTVIEVDSCNNRTGIDQVLDCHNQDAELFFFFLRRRNMATFRKTLHRHGLTVLSRIIAVPRLTTPRWYLPAERTILQKAGTIIKPSKPIAVIGWRLMQLLNRFNGGHWLFPGQMIVAERQHDKHIYRPWLAAHLEKQAGLPMKDRMFILYTGSYGIYQKWTAQIMDKKDGTIVAYAKIGNSSRAAGRLEREAQVLAKISRQQFDHLDIPAVRYFGKKTGDIPAILVQTPAKPCYKKFRKTFGTDHLNALVELAEKTTEMTDGNKILKKIKTVGTEISNILPELRKTADHSLSLLAGKLADTLVPTAFSHGDFSPWNTLFADDGRLFLFDWELAERRVWLWDYFNFIFHSNILIKKKKPGAIVYAMQIAADDIAYFRQAYPADKDLDSNVLLLIFNMELLSFYVTYRRDQATAGFVPEPSIDHMIAALVTMLRETNNLMGDP